MQHLDAIFSEIGGQLCEHPMQKNPSYHRKQNSHCSIIIGEQLPERVLMDLLLCISVKTASQWVTSAPNKYLCDMEKIYDLVPRTDDVFNLNRSDLELHDELGAGNFGSVMRGTYRHKGMQIPVAVKTLKKDDMPTAEVVIALTFCIDHRLFIVWLVRALVLGC